MRRDRRVVTAAAGVTLAACGLLAGPAAASTTPIRPVPSAPTAAPHLRYATSTVAPPRPGAGRDDIGTVPGSASPYSFSPHRGRLPTATGSTPAAAARPHSPKASAVLRTLAKRAAAQPRKARTGRFEYEKMLGVYGTNPADLREQWVADNGSGRLRDVVEGKATSELFKAGGLSAPVKLPTDPRKLQALLAKSHPAYGTYEWFVAVNDVWDLQIVNPGVQSALLLMLTGKPGMVDRGKVTDARGRKGIAISTDANHSGRFRTTLVFNARTGALLDFDQHALTAAGKPSTAPTADSNTAWLVEGYAETVSQRP